MTQNYEIPKMFEYLENTLVEELAVYEMLYKIVRVKQRNIIINDIEALNTSVFKEKHLIARGETLAKNRVEHVSEMAKAHGLSDPFITLKELLILSDAPNKQNFISLRNRLEYFLKQISRVNKENKYLIQSALDHVDSMVRLFIRDEESTKTIYQGNGKMTEDSNIRKLVNVQV